MKNWTKTEVEDAPKIDIRAKDLEADDYLIGSESTIISVRIVKTSYLGLAPKRLVQVEYLNKKGNLGVGRWNPSTTMRIIREAQQVSNV